MDCGHETCQSKEPVSTIDNRATILRSNSHGNAVCFLPVGISHNKVIGRNPEAIGPVVVSSLSGTLDGREYFCTDFLQFYYHNHMGIDFAQGRFVSNAIR